VPDQEGNFQIIARAQWSMANKRGTEANT